MSTTIKTDSQASKIALRIAQDMQSLVSYALEDCDERGSSAEFASKSAHASWIQSLHSGAEFKRKKVSEVSAQIKDLLDPAALPGEEDRGGSYTPEVIMSKVDGKVGFLDTLEAQIHSLENLKAEAMKVHLAEFGETWKPWARRSTSPGAAAQNLAALRKRFA